MAEIEALRVQQYSTNLTMLSQQKMPKLANYCMMQNAAGSKAFRMMSQIDKTDAVLLTTRATPAMNVDIVHDGRWVYPSAYAWGKVIDQLDLLETNISPQGTYVQSAVAAFNRQQDDNFLSAFFGTAKTGETGSTDTTFDSNNVVAVDTGGAAATGLNVDKLVEAREILELNDVDMDMETVYIGVYPKQLSDMLKLTPVTSADFNNVKALVDGKVNNFMGFTFVTSNRLPTDGDSYRRLPVWVPSGMGCGVWKELSGTIRTRPDLQNNPAYAEVSMEKGYTRLEEAKCVEIKCSE